MDHTQSANEPVSGSPQQSVVRGRTDRPVTESETVRGTQLDAAIKALERAIKVEVGIMEMYGENKQYHEAGKRCEWLKGMNLALGVIQQQANQVKEAQPCGRTA